MTFTEAQTRLLEGKLNRRHVQTRGSRGQVLSYVEGWHVIAEANRVFGFASAIFRANVVLPARRGLTINVTGVSASTSRTRNSMNRSYTASLRRLPR